MKRLLNWLQEPANVLLAMILAGMIAIVVMSWSTTAKAEGLKPSKSTVASPLLAAAALAPAPFSGCGPIVRAGWVIGTLDTPSPVTLASEGGALGFGAGCDWQVGGFLAGVFASYDWAFNDLKTLGVNSDLTLGARLGLPVKHWMPYVGAAWSQVGVDGIGKIDGWKLLGGVEVRLATEAPLFGAIEVSRAMYDNVAGSSIDVNATAVTGKLTYKFGGK